MAANPFEGVAGIALNLASSRFQYLKQEDIKASGDNEVDQQIGELTTLFKSMNTLFTNRRISNIYEEIKSKNKLDFLQKGFGNLNIGAIKARQYEYKMGLVRTVIIIVVLVVILLLVIFFVSVSKNQSPVKKMQFQASQGQTGYLLTNSLKNPSNLAKAVFM